MDYIDQNAVKAGLALNPFDWKASGAFYKVNNITGLVDYSLTERQKYIKLLSPIPPLVSKLLPPAQLAHTIQYFGAYAEQIDRLNKLIPAIPKIGETETEKEPTVYLHYYTGTADYFISEFDGEDTMSGKVHFSAYNPTDDSYRKFSLSNLKSNEFMQLDFSWR